MILIEFLVKSLLITNMITLAANSMGEHKMFNILTHFHICYMNGPIYYMKGQILKAKFVI